MIWGHEHSSHWYRGIYSNLSIILKMKAVLTVCKTLLFFCFFSGQPSTPLHWGRKACQCRSNSERISKQTDWSNSYRRLCINFHWGFRWFLHVGQRSFDSFWLWAFDRAEPCPWLRWCWTRWERGTASRDIFREWRWCWWTIELSGWDLWGCRPDCLFVPTARGRYFSSADRAYRG